MAQGLLAPAGVVFSGESQRTVPPPGNTGPATLQFTPEVNCTLAVVMSPGPATPFNNAPVGIAFTPSADTPCCDTKTLKPSITGMMLPAPRTTHLESPPISHAKPRRGEKLLLRGQSELMPCPNCTRPVVELGSKLASWLCASEGEVPVSYRKPRFIVRRGLIRQSSCANAATADSVSCRAGWPSRTEGGLAAFN